MAYTDLFFFAFFLIVSGICFVIPEKLRSVWLLLASYAYIYLWDVKSCFFLLCVTLITYLGGRLMEICSETNGAEDRKKSEARPILILVLVSVFGLLIFMKYGEFAAVNSVKIWNKLGGDVSLRFPDLVLPLGLSFCTFASVGYTIDVYTGKRSAEKNLIKYALFTSFFPNISAGPIERSHNLLRQIHEYETVKLWDYQRIASGVMLALWGYFQKLVIADRAAVPVSEIFNHCQNYGSSELIFGAILFSIQIYADFAGGSCMALGCAKILGFDLIDNFDAPYFALSIREFWRRWHISLSSWFRDYLYIPLGGNRKGEKRKYLNLLIVFLVSGIWHGANWTFLIWGLIHGIYQVIGGITRKKRLRLYQKLKIDTSSTAFSALSRLCTFALTAFAWIFFRAGSLSQAMVYVYRMLTYPDIWNVMNGKIYELGLDITEMNILFCAVAVLFFVDWLRYKKKKTLPELLGEQQYLVRLLFAAAILAAVIFFGCYGSSFGANAFIYAEF